MILHRILYSSGKSSAMRSPVDGLQPLLERFYRHFALELEHTTGILAVALNEAFEEALKGGADTACGLLTLAESEWQRLGQSILALQDLMLKYGPLLTFAVPLRSAAPRLFRSATMQEHVKAHEKLDQFILRPKLRFRLHISVLRSGSQMLATEFRQVAWAARTLPSELERQLISADLLFHDFDLVVKDSLLALRMVLAALPTDQVSEFEAELKAATRREADEPSFVSKS